MRTEEEPNGLALAMLEFTNPNTINDETVESAVPDVIVVPITGFEVESLVELKNSPMDSWYEKILGYELLAPEPLSTLLSEEDESVDEDQIVDEIVDAGVCTKVSIVVQPSRRPSDKKPSADNRNDYDVYSLVLPEPSKSELYALLGFED